MQIKSIEKDSSLEELDKKSNELGMGGFIVSDSDDTLERIVDQVIRIPDCSEFLQPFLTLVPLQLLAYTTALELGRDPDQPRNLAKTVTVE